LRSQEDLEIALSLSKTFSFSPLSVLPYPKQKPLSSSPSLCYQSAHIDCPTPNISHHFSHFHQPQDDNQHQQYEENYVSRTLRARYPTFSPSFSLRTTLAFTRAFAHGRELALGLAFPAAAPSRTARPCPDSRDECSVVARHTSPRRPLSILYCHVLSPLWARIRGVGSRSVGGSASSARSHSESRRAISRL
jgi:hypothetical protein